MSIAVSFYREPDPIIEEKIDVGANMKVFGIGGGGGNTVTRMIESGFPGVEFVVLNTDKQALQTNFAPTKIQLGESGRGAGANAQVGRKAAEQSVKEIEKLLVDTELLFLTIGMGGGTGTGAGPVIAQIARKTVKDILIVAIVTKPFKFEGVNRMAVAERGIRELSQFVDTLVVIPNEKLLSDDQDLTIEETWLLADNVVTQATRGISGLISVPGQINADLNDVRTVMSGGGSAVLGIGRASGENRGEIAAQRAIECPLVEHVSMTGAKKVLLGVTYPPGEKMRELQRAGEVIQREAGGNADIIFGTSIDKNLGDEIVVTVIATGLDYKEEKDLDGGQLTIDLLGQGSNGNSPIEGDISEELSESEEPAVKEPELVVIEHEPRSEQAFPEATLHVVTSGEEATVEELGAERGVQWGDMEQADSIQPHVETAVLEADADLVTTAQAMVEEEDDSFAVEVERCIETSYRAAVLAHRNGSGELSHDEFEKLDLSEPAFFRYFGG